MQETLTRMLTERGHSCPKCAAKKMQMSVSGMYDIRGSVERDILHLQELWQYGAFQSDALPLLEQLYSDLRQLARSSLGIDVVWIAQTMDKFRNMWSGPPNMQVEDMFPNLAIHLS